MSKKQLTPYEQHRANVNKIIAELERELARMTNKEDK